MHQVRTRPSCPICAQAMVPRELSRDEFGRTSVYECLNVDCLDYGVIKHASRLRVP